MLELLAHLIGDYVLQTKNMALRKSTSYLWAAIHGLAYTIPFVFITQDLLKLGIIAVSHFAIDRWRVVDPWMRLKDHVAAVHQAEGAELPGTEVPIWVSFWLTIIVDNTLHLAINHGVLNYL